ncbi:hypothetical protein W97_06938 [Coniosporium apollinis CBS 100218]|uniref:DUF2231 domain-containing protein n=1 Tax=Coniosporium apollinis (strain CBS 100218) TaxID=1168221 RepID=R7Z056_CONA1|nr:uncharacterized protein W97_06938 [Coniosporium apollinis CBS 100218]EON67570.1 hypothetical protein W97_06938 [Coniosporium apollinis CBS 100218]
MSTFSKLWQAAGLGKFDDNSHPIHPATVHYPIAFLSLHYALDVLYGSLTHPSIASYIPSSIAAQFTPYIADIAKASHFSNALGILSALPSAATGGAELYAMIQSNGLWEVIKRESDGKVVYGGMNPKVRHGIFHALMNDVVLVASLYDWWTRRNTTGFIPTGTHQVMSAAALPMLFFSAYLGGAMVYKYGVGVQRMGEAKRIKEDSGRDELKRDEGYTKVKERKGQ